MDSTATAASQPPINVAIMWHMHQPEYRNMASGEYRLPWTYLHAIKDYVDMAAHLENQREAKAVINFAPILLEQLEDYGRQIDAFFATDEAIRDPLLNSLIHDEPYRSDRDERLWLIDACVKANEKTLIDRYPAFAKLVNLARHHIDNDSLNYLYRQFFIDLTVWYHLAWMGETLKRNHPVIHELITKGENFDKTDREQLIRIIGEQIRSIIPRYRTLWEAGRIEIAMSPYAHPMLPLLIDFNSALEAMPDGGLPEASVYPGGPERVRWHLEKGIHVFERCFGRRPDGIWPSEGGVSQDIMPHLEEFGFQWLASGDNVLGNSTIASHDREKGCRHHPYQTEKGGIQMFFRDDGLSDLVGFTYSTWHADDAISDLVGHLRQIREHCQKPGESIVSIILDGENAWEYYPENGYYFLDGLYRALAEHPDINLTTYSEYLVQNPKVTLMEKLTAGSWVYGTFSTWIGDQAKNRAWDLLCNAKTAVDEYLRENPHAKDDRNLMNQLAICEGSDWFWWFGDYNPEGSVRDFDDLYRLNLKNLYTLIGKEAPEALNHTISSGESGGHMEHGGVMRRGG